MSQGEVFSGFLDKKGRNTGHYATRFFRLSSGGLLLEYKIDAKKQNGSETATATNVYSDVVAASEFERGDSGSFASPGRRQNSSGLMTPRGSKRHALVVLHGDGKSRTFFTKDIALRNEWVDHINKTCREGFRLMPAGGEASVEAKHKFVDGPIGISFIVDQQRVLISRVRQGSQADISGVRVGDVVSKINGAKVGAYNDSSLFEKDVSGMSRPLEISLLRYGEQHRHTFDALPFGIECMVEGFVVRVVRVHSDTPAAAFGVVRNDIIVELNDRPFDLPRDAVDFASQIGKMSRPLSMTFRRFGSTPRNQNADPAASSILSPPVAATRGDDEVRNSKPSDTSTTQADTQDGNAPSPDEAGVPSEPTSLDQPSGDVGEARTNAPKDEKKTSETGALRAKSSSNGSGDGTGVPSESLGVSNHWGTTVEVVALEPQVEGDHVKYRFKIVEKAQGRERICVHRYSEFTALRTALIRRDAVIEAFPFPGKTLVRRNSMRPGIVEMRKDVLALWLQKVLDTHKTQPAVELVSFLAS